MKLRGAENCGKLRRCTSILRVSPLNDPSLTFSITTCDDTKSLLIEERDKGGEKVRREKEDEQTDESQGVKTKVEGN